MASYVLTQINAAIHLFTSLIQHGARTPRYKSNLRWLSNLRTRVMSKISEASNMEIGHAQRHGDAERQSNNGGEHQEQDEDVELLGWRTRLIERAGQGRRKTIRTIRLVETPTDSQATEFGSLPLDESQPGDQLGLMDMALPSASLPGPSLDSTNDLVRLRINAHARAITRANVPF